MERQHINERGTHTSVIESSVGVISILSKGISGLQVSPGKIEAMVGAKSNSVKFKHINDELYEMVIVCKGSRQEFKVFTKAGFDELKGILRKDKKTRDWSINYTDMRNVHSGMQLKKDSADLDKKYKV